MKFRLTRTVTWLDRDFKEGDEVFKYSGYTYGCISGNGMACCDEENKTPFFELPMNALDVI